MDTQYASQVVFLFRLRQSIKIAMTFWHETCGKIVFVSHQNHQHDRETNYENMYYIHQIIGCSFSPSSPFVDCLMNYYP